MLTLMAILIPHGCLRLGKVQVHEAMDNVKKLVYENGGTDEVKDHLCHVLGSLPHSNNFLDPRSQYRVLYQRCWPCAKR